MSSVHTATPFHCKKLVGVTDRGFALFETKNRISGVTTHRLDTNGEFSQEDAEFIVRACNAHADLIQLLTELRDSTTAFSSAIEVDCSHMFDAKVWMRRANEEIAKAAA